MVKNVHFNQMTVMADGKGDSDMVEEGQLIEWILENEPSILVEVSKFWVFNVFSLT